MTASGWVFIIASWTGILALFAWSMYRTLRESKHYVEEEPFDDDAKNQ